MTPTAITALAIFIFTYVLISARRLHVLPLGRPAAAMLGATLMVVCGVVTPEQAYTEAIDGNTIVLLLGMMILTEHLKEAGFFDLAARWSFQVAGSPQSLLIWLGATAGVLSALLVNDTICLLMTPLVVQILNKAKLPRFPYLMTLATSSNIGSVMTLVGNPQNMIIGSLAQKAGHGVDFLSFAVVMVPVGAICLAIHLLFLRWIFRSSLPAQWEEGHDVEVKIDRPLLIKSLLVFAGVSLAFCLRFNPAWSALAGACAVFILARQRPPTGEVLARLDWSLLLFFAGLFISVHGLATSGVNRHLWDALSGLWETSELVKYLNLLWVSVLGSNVVSNVPFIKLIEGEMAHFPDPARAWMLLALATTFAGNLTLLGSVANIIVMETSREPVGFWEYFRIGFPATLLSCTLGTGLLLAITGF